MTAVLQNWVIRLLSEAEAARGTDIRPTANSTRIQIFDNHSLVDLPKGMPEDVFNSLQRLRVMNRELQISKAS